MVTAARLSVLIASRITRSQSPQKLFDVAAETIISAYEIDAADAQDKAHALLPALRRELEEHIEKRNILRQACDFCFAASDTPYLQGTDYISPAHDAEARVALEARTSVEDIKKAVLQLSPAQFESLMGKILEGLGLQDVYITKSSSDDGLDFFGCLNIGVNDSKILLDDHFSHELELFVVGQAKRYTTSKFKLGELRELIGSVTLLKSNISARATAQKWPRTLRIADPVLNLFVISNEVSASGWRLAEQSGVRVLDINKLGILLADLRISHLDDFGLAGHA